MKKVVTFTYVCHCYIINYQFIHFPDPEEFLNFLLKKVFVTTPFLEIRYVNAVKTPIVTIVGHMAKESIITICCIHE